MKITENFCNYTISKDLKELGMDEKCLAHYHYNIHNVCKDKGLLWKLKFRITDKANSQYVQAPLLQQATNWLYNKHDILISIIPESDSRHKLLERTFNIVIYRFVLNLNVQPTILRDSDNKILRYNSYDNALIAALQEAILLVKNK